MCRRAREEEHVARLDERAVVLVDPVVDDSLLDPIRKAPRVESILKAAVALVVERHRFIIRFVRAHVYLYVLFALAAAGCGGNQGGKIDKEGEGTIVVAALGDSIHAGTPYWDPDPDVRARIGDERLP